MIDPDLPDRLFVALSGRTAPDPDHVFDPVSLIVAADHSGAGLGLEERAIIQACVRPLAVVEISAHLRLPLGAITVLLSGLLQQGHVSVRHPRTHTAARVGGTGFVSWQPPDLQLLERTLVALRNL
ncbi:MULTISPECIES: DUF742 domain-containing protein [Streptomyces]|uniref:DUF742 domain-containing protein n=1 Tax=Streptomyces doudnae TaxID=3075536 RepID=A0ABD5EVB6_9ACTN|nr:MULTISPECIES: DUF742 domain-containing protein [unclassified Streptomyces]MDT0438656.1 DUF742 domain-containing protein [Streptomyces sp. DSM 41981]MYQ62067.1 DUF742 domain-containing protein [Streptomyces sp. SID4950]SCD29739.1 Protein of unknown function [Streptomyces sp. SolWspMP-5a-2]